MFPFETQVLELTENQNVIDKSLLNFISQHYYKHHDL